MAIKLEAAMDIAGVYRPKVDTARCGISIHCFATDINAGALTLHTIVAGQRVVVTDVETTPAAGIFQITENAVVVYQHYMAAAFQQFTIPPILLDAVGIVGITARAGCAVDMTVKGLLWVERTI